MVLQAKKKKKKDWHFVIRLTESSTLPFGFAVKPKLTVTIDTNVNSTVLNLVDDVSSWEPGDRIVIASTDYSMYQAEEFQVLPCPSCRPTQVKVAGEVIHLVTLVLHFTNSIIFTE